MLMLAAGSAGAQPPSSPQFARDRWGQEEGLPAGAVNAIAQTPDGYLWIGTDAGLVRFDGVNFHQMTLPPGMQPAAARVLGLVVDGGGSLWIRLAGSRLLKYRERQFDEVLSVVERSDAVVTAMATGRDGSVLADRLADGAQRFRGATVEQIASPRLLPNALVISIAETGDGRIWLGTRDAGLFVVEQGRVTPVSEGLPDKKINCLLPAGDRELWIGTDNGVVLWDGTAVRHPIAWPDHLQALAMAADRAGNLHVASVAHGVLIAQPDGRISGVSGAAATSGTLNAIFEDREGDLWVGGERGLERLRNAAFVNYSEREGLPPGSAGAIHPGLDGDIWVAPVRGGLFRLRDGQATPVHAASLDSDVVYSIAAAGRELWLGRQRDGLTRLPVDADPGRVETYRGVNGLAQDSVYTVFTDSAGAVWAGTLTGGVSRWQDGRFTTYATDSGLASNTVTAIAETGDVLWLGTPAGLSSLTNGQWRTYHAADGLPSDAVTCLFADTRGVLWVGTGAGPGVVTSRRVTPLGHLPALLRQPILGIAEDKVGGLWISTPTRVTRVPRDLLLAGKVTDEDVRAFDASDGLGSSEGVKRDRSLIADTAGRIWVSTSQGLSVVDPRRLAPGDVPAGVDVQALTADGEPVELQEFPHVSAGRQRLTVTYAGLSFRAPERTRYRYRLDGFDRDWSDPVAAREAVYTNLGPGTYRFRVVASNAAGRWNGSEATLSFAIDPRWWQTWWFRVAMVIGVAGLAAALYRYRMLQVARQLGLRYEERLAERTRIAQELHDTLLQGFLSASMQLHVAADRLPADSPAKPSLARVLQLMSHVIEEGRNAVRGLRASSPEGDNLEHAFRAVPQEMAVPDQTEFRVIVDGRPRPLHPVIRDEIYRIGREALGNAFRHASAALVEVEIEYTARQLRLLVRDDGVGMDERVVRSGRDGHWGLSGMRERTDRIGGQFKVWSRPGAGTEVVVTLPGHLAFAPEARP